MTSLRSGPAAALPAPATTSERVIRGDIQGMRAVAVAAVVIYHFAPARLPGGYVGVDVFFVISGFLITAHLLRELERTGSIRLRSFYSRRIRRLLPTAILVLAITVAASFALLPSSQLVETLRQAAASASYVENWLLATSVVDYMAQDAAPTPVQHYWSLSVEEQFYLVWPAALLLVAWIARRRESSGSRRPILAMLLALGGISLALSVVLTDVDRASAYFVTPTRIWEFVVGGLLAFVPRVAFGQVLPAVVAWFGLILIGCAAFSFTSATEFPGLLAAIPVAGTAAVIWGGGAQSRWWMPGRWLGFHPFRFVGDSSYAIYLWHWPVLVLLPLAIGTMSTWQRLSAIAAVVVLGWLTTRFFEAPTRRSRWMSSAPAPWVLAIVSALVFCGLWGFSNVAVQARASAVAAEAQASVGSPCYGAAALIENCEPLSGDPSTVDPVLAAADAQNPEYTRCDQPLDESALVVCAFGPKDASTRLALVGDSHATQWLGALARIADDRGWRVDTYLKSSCPLTRATRVLAGEPRERARHCVEWQEEVRTKLAATDVDAVLVSAYARGYQWADRPGGEISDQAGIDGFAQQWIELNETVAPVIVIADTPFLGGMSIPDCVATTTAPFLECSALRHNAVVPDVMTAAAAATAGSANVATLDMSDLFCDTSRCYPVIGGEIVFRDSSHLTWNFAASSAPELARRLSALEGL